MALNTQVASILQQAAARRKGVVRSTFQPNPDATDHSERKVDYEIVLEGKNDPLKGLFVVEDKALGQTPADILDRITGEKAEAKDVPDAKFYLDTTVKRLLEM